MGLGEEENRRKDSPRQPARVLDQILFLSYGKQKLSMYIFNTLGSCYCLIKKQSACIINNSACIINVWGYTEIFTSFFPDNNKIKLNYNQKISCEGLLSAEECLVSLKTMESQPQRNQDKWISDFQAYAVEKIDWSKIVKLNETYLKLKFD